MPIIRQRNKQTSRLLPKQAVELMTQWYDRNYADPYPTFRDCEILASNGNITIEQVKQWFVNVRRRTQNQFRKQRTSYNLKRKLTESCENEQEIEPGEVLRPKTNKQKIEINQDVNPLSSACAPLYPAINYPTNYNFNNNLQMNQYFDNSGHFVPSLNSSYDFNISNNSNNSFDFTSPNSSFSNNYSNVQYNNINFAYPNNQTANSYTYYNY